MSNLDDHCARKMCDHRRIEACQGLKGFDAHGSPSADHVGRYCGICAGTGRAK